MDEGFHWGETVCGEWPLENSMKGTSLGESGFARERGKLINLAIARHGGYSDKTGQVPTLVELML